jgi:hypothetical protein
MPRVIARKNLRLPITGYCAKTVKSGHTAWREVRLAPDWPLNQYFKASCGVAFR